MRSTDGKLVSWPRWLQRARWLAPFLALLIICFGFGVADPRFATFQNFQAIASSSAVPMILAVGMTFIILQGSIDLSIEGVMGAASIVFALLVLNTRTGMDLGIIGFFVAVVLGAAIGATSGAIVTKLRVPSFMVTLGAWSFASGLAILLSAGDPPLVRDQVLRTFGLGHGPFGLPNLALLAVAVVAVGLVLQSYTRFGRYSYMIGGGEDIVRLSGIKVNRYKIFAFAFSGALAGLAGAAETARIGVGSAEIGPGQMFATITAVVIGGTALAGGRGGVIQSAIGVLILTVLANGMIYVGVTPYLQQAVQGGIVLVAVVATTWHLRHRMRVVK